ncbi:amidohydrolase 2 [Patulibacter medicamentivorans]|uniref:Amidohydrolase 2 n=1 Tax=Patulibacter medicamentivorans TaxID=1097667 RepID=H0E074_9ACTN|nr:amidohydrolase family protein [Patulibacter medicamentivorans]EHN12877.1 amidohydrolase 2 [Patulibacter medicamentivorans]
MHDGMFIFDNAIHAYDNSSINVLESDRAAADHFTVGPGSVGQTLAVFPQLDRSGRLESDPDFGHKRLGVDEALKLLFEDSDTDMAMAQTVPIKDFWKDFLYPLQLNYELKQAAPDRILFCGAVDPTTMTTKECLASMEHQVRELGATSFKFYQSGADEQHWMADDREVAYPIFEKALELGVTCLQFHKGFAFSQQIMGPWLRCEDLQRPARDFPEATFVIHHLGWPYEDASIQIASRFPNMVMSYAGLIQFYPLMPDLTLHALGKALLFLGPDRVLYGSEGFVWPNVQSTIEMFNEMQFSDEMQDRWGYPEITRDIREKLFGRNFARIMGVDIDAKSKLLGVS